MSGGGGGYSPQRRCRNGDGPLMQVDRQSLAFGHGPPGVADCSHLDPLGTGAQETDFLLV